MRTVGEILKKARLEKNILLEDVEKTLRIRKKFLLALEENAWNKLPALPYIKGFIRNYSNYLGLKPDEMLAIFRRQFSFREKGTVLPEGLAHPLDEPVFRFTPQVLVGVTIISFIVFFFGYLFLQFKNYTSPPNLAINSPKEGEVINTDKIEITGKTDADAVVSVNNLKIAVNEKGEFTSTVRLNPGINTINIESVSKYGKKRTINRTIQVNI